MKICFFCKIADRNALNVIDFYKQDIEALRKIDQDLLIATSWKEIDFSCDIIFVWWWTYAIYPVLAGRLLGKKVVITGTFNYKSERAPLDYFRRPFYHRIMIKMATKMAHKNIFVSKNEFDSLTKDWNLKNAIYSPHGVKVQKKLQRQKPKHPFLFSMIFTSKIGMKRKSFKEIIIAAGMLKDEFPALKILIGGRKGDGYNLAQEYIKEYNVENNVTLLGEISEECRNELYQQCTIYLQPSTYEGFGLAIAEAMSYGAVVISTKVGEVENVVGDSGILLAGNTPVEIADAIRQCLNSTYNLPDLSTKAHQRILNLYTVEKRYKTLKMLISELV